MTTSQEAWQTALQYVGTNRLKYIAGQWVCREYSALFGVIAAGVLGIDAVGRVVDFSGKHSYNAIVVPDKTGGFRVMIIEPQTDRVVEGLDPKHHYVGKSGFVTWG